MSVQSFNPRNGQGLELVAETGSAGVKVVVGRASAAAMVVAQSSPQERQRWLNGVAEALEQNRDELVELAESETALGVARLTGELSRMADQLRFYGAVATDGGYLQVTVDDATDVSPRLVRINQPIGPIAVFGSSNFPFAFGVLGNDTGSAIAAGCPVVGKAHSAHVLTSRRLAQIAIDAFALAGAPENTLSLVVGRAAGAQLVAEPNIKGVGFTGSQAGGLALWRIANERAEVIPVYAEMGTVNPVVVTESGLVGLDELVHGFVGSFTIGAGQFCTKPGLLFAPAGRGVAEAVAEAMVEAAPQPVMLTQSIAESVASGLDEMIAAGAKIIGRVFGPGTGWSADAAVLSAPINALIPGSVLLEECFGSVAIVVEYEGREELETSLRLLQGSLVASVFGNETDPDVARIVEILAGQAGRVTLGDWPTGVAWTWAQHHGGPWPATTDPRSTSVGASALDRFVRPVTFQSVPDNMLPPMVRAAVGPNSPRRIPRRTNGVVFAP